MAITQTATRIAIEAGNDVKLAFNFSFKIFAETEITVFKKTAAGAFVAQVLTTDYSVTFDTDAEIGTVTYVTAPEGSGGESHIIGSAPQSQGSVFPREGVTPAKTIENALDRATVLSQELQEKIDRTALQPLTPTQPNKIEIEAPITGKGVRWLASGGKFILENTTTDPDAAQVAAAASAAAAAASAAAAAVSETNAAASAAAAAVSETNAAASAVAAAASAVTAVNAAQSAWFRDVVFITFSASPFSITNTERGKMISVDATAGNVIVNLPIISGLDLTSPFVIAVKKTDAGANTVTINRASTDTIDGATSRVLSLQNDAVIIVPDTDPSPDLWTTLAFGSIADGSITTAKLNAQVFNGLATVAIASTDHVAIADVDDSGDKKKALVSDILNLDNGPKWQKFTVAESAFLPGTSQVEAILLFMLPAGNVLHGVRIKHSVAFSGGTLTGFTIEVGISGDLTRYASAFDVFQAVSNITFQMSQTFHAENQGSATSINITARSVGDDVVNATAGSVDVWLLISKPPA